MRGNKNDERGIVRVDVEGEMWKKKGNRTRETRREGKEKGRTEAEVWRQKVVLLKKMAMKINKNHFHQQDNTTFSEERIQRE